MHNSDIAIIILAAGGSSRLVKPKQLLSYKNSTLLGHAIETAKSTDCDSIHVLVGANHREISAEIISPEITVVENKDWQSGMASSIHAGISSLDKDVPGVLIMLCDQPLIDSAHLTKLISAFNRDGKITATAYEGIAGVPAVFPKVVFPDLLDLKGDEGARKLIKARESEVVTIPFENAFLDIDTDADYQKLMTILANHNN